MADRELRIRAIADVAQAKAALQSLSGEQVKQQAAATAADAASKRQAADLAKLQLEQAKATGAGSEAVKRLSQEFKAAAAEAKVAAAEAKVLARAASEVRVQERNQAFAVRQADRQKSLAAQIAAAAQNRMDAEGAAEAKVAARAERFALKRTGLVPEGVMSESGMISGAAVAGGLSAAIAAGIVAGFKGMAQEERDSQKAMADRASPVVDLFNEISKAGRENGMSEAAITRLLDMINNIQGVATTSALANAALGKLKEGDTAGATAEVMRVSAGETPLNDLMKEERRRREIARLEEVTNYNTQVKSVRERVAEEQAKAERERMTASGLGTPIGWLAATTASPFTGEAGQLAAYKWGNKLTREGAIPEVFQGMGIAYWQIKDYFSQQGNTGQQVEGQGQGSSRFDPIFVESNQPRRLGGD